MDLCHVPIYKALKADTKEMVTGYLVIDEMRSKWYIFTGTFFKFPRTRNSNSREVWSYYEILPDTCMENTKFKDQNQKMIFDHDKVVAQIEEARIVGVISKGTDGKWKIIDNQKNEYDLAKHVNQVTLFKETDAEQKTYIKVGQAEGTTGNCSILRGWYGQGYIVKDELAFLTHSNRPCYVPELHDILYTWEDFMTLCNGQEEFASDCFYGVDWQAPESYIDEMVINKEWGWCKMCKKLYYKEDEEQGCPYCGESE